MVNPQLDLIDELTDAVAAGAAEGQVVLAMLGNLPVEQVEEAMIADHLANVLIQAKGIGISSPIAKMILARRRPEGRITERGLDQCLGIFSRLRPATARQVMDFRRKRATPAA